MAEITPKLVGELREMTNAGLMACKNALVESNGDLDAAVDILRKKGAASAAKKADREAKEGLIAQAVLPGARVGVLVEFNCETDFVARNDGFKIACDDIARKIASQPGVELEADRVALVAKIGENIQVRRQARLEVQGNGLVAAYIHTGGKVGVLVEVGAGKEGTAGTEEFKQLVRDITLQIAAGHPTAVSPAQVPAEVVQKERDIAVQSDALKGKPAAAMENILKGKLEKFYQTICLTEQGFVKNPDLTVKAHIASVGKALGDEITVRGFVRFQVGEA